MVNLFGLINLSTLLRVFALVIVSVIQMMSLAFLAKLLAFFFQSETIDVEPTHLVLVILVILLSSLIQSYLTYYNMLSISKCAMLKLEPTLSYELERTVYNGGESEYLSSNYSSDISRLQVTFLNNLATGITHSIILTVIIFYLLINATVPFLFLLSFVMVGFFILVLFLRPYQRRMGYEISDRAIEGITLTSSIFNNRVFIRYSGAINFFSKWWSDVISEWMTTIVKSTFWSQQGKVVFEFAIYMALAIALLIANFGNNLSSPDLIYQLSLLSALSIKLLPGLNAFSNCVQSLYANYKSLERLKSKNRSIDNNKNPIELDYLKIDFKNNLNCDLNKFYPGQKIAILGSSGSGKSTLIDSLLLDKAATCIFNKNYEMSLAEVHASKYGIQCVDQEPIFFPTTVEKNLLTPLEVTDELNAEMKRLCILFELVENEKAYNKLLNKRIFNNGENFSGGEKQRLAIIRALIKKPKILILDEATSALDTRMEKIVMSEISNMSIKSIMFIVSHRLQPLKGCTQMIYVKNQKVVSVEPYDETLCLKRMVS